ncbi:Lrp/AsnC family transcriptional regulator [Brevibacillus humidisoli]|uniref:Lrp/AsnC family transcriptional regulator n=1 Tax=Brevibacillus humidisoli TaxID=2895522 RepID=UPI001E4C97D9|nr:Lrp/AsnC family transcriptional regulator [Brevibacillus humidisoli]UFJ42866.1 Lrp/AsnC family transcriptional regulator [Brevibacillus humidisoli]
MKKTIDQVDKQILQILRQDGRTAYTEIAHQLGISEGTVRSRITRLLQEGVFGFSIHTDPSKLGLHVQTIVGLTTKLGLQQNVAEELCKLPEVYFVGAFSGKHDLIIQACFQDNEELITFVNERLSQIEGILAADVSLELKRYKDSISFVRHDEVVI